MVAFLEAMVVPLVTVDSPLVGKKLVLKVWLDAVVSLPLYVAVLQAKPRNLVSEN